MRDEKAANPGGPTAVSCCGANPGMVSWFVKEALLTLAKDTGRDATPPTSREGWAKLMQSLGVKGVHIAERDTQARRQPRPRNVFVNTWSVEGFIAEGFQPAELGWGTHEKWFPENGHKFETGCQSAIWLDRPGAISWAGYSILYRSEPLRRVGNMPLFALVAIFGALSNLPIALWELAQGDALPTQAHSWAAIAGIVLIASLLAFSTFQYGIRVLGASIAGVFMYLLPPYGVGLAILFLGEEFHTYHAAGIALVMAGVITATFPAKLLGRLKAKPA